ncbi:MAG: phage tail tube protein [Cetobacterium sp.]
MATLWSNVQVTMEASLDPADAITGISNAAPAVATSNGHGIVNGSYVFLRAEGMPQLDERVVRIANATANDVQFEGTNSLQYDVFAAVGVNQMQKITFGPSFKTIFGLNASGGDATFVETTTIHVNYGTQIPGKRNPIIYNFQNVWKPFDAGLQAMLAASEVKQLRAFKFRFPDGLTMVFSGYPSASLVPTGQAQGLVETATSISMQGYPFYYAS